MPSTLIFEVPESTSLVVRSTEIPTGIMTISVVSRPLGTTPPHVRAELKIPDNTAVNTVARTAQLKVARKKVSNPNFFKLNEFVLLISGFKLF
jgi:hypothetical protein